jgi:hypothetical protein
MKRTPSQPPMRARSRMREYSREKPRKIRAGKVKMTPPATDSPAEPVVWTTLFSRMVALPRARSREMDSTAMGMEAATVRPARRPTYTVTAPKTIPKSMPRTTARGVNSGSTVESGT